MKQARIEREKRKQYAKEYYLRKKATTPLPQDVLPQSQEEKEL